MQSEGSKDVLAKDSPILGSLGQGFHRAARPVFRTTIGLDPRDPSSWSSLRH